MVGHDLPGQLVVGVLEGGISWVYFTVVVGYWIGAEAQGAARPPPLCMMCLSGPSLGPESSERGVLDSLLLCCCDAAAHFTLAAGGFSLVHRD